MPDSEKELKTLKDIDEYGFQLVSKVMLKEAGREWINAITSGKFPYVFDTKRKGELAKDLWYDSKFTLGMEYGLICAFEMFFNLEEEE